MALLIDGPPSTLRDLSNQDSGLLDVCRTEQIDAMVKIRLAHEEISLELSTLFEDQRSVYSFYYGQSRLKIGHVAITPSLKNWHVYTSLALVYRDAYFTQLNDRYQAKWQEYQSLAWSAKQQLQKLGVGLVLDPLPRPNGPTLDLIPATEAGGTFYYSATLVNACGEESSGSLTGSLELPAGNALSFQLRHIPANASGWNIYVGDSPAQTFRQNDTSLAADDTWVFYPSTAATRPHLPGDGQAPNFLRALPRLLQRG
jgi:hypothetical protein